MVQRLYVLFALVAVFACTGASYRTPNFVVQAPNAQLAKQFGQYAEKYRREKAIQWLGREMPRWGQPCPLVVNVTMEPPSGATSFNFGTDRMGNGVIMGQHMQINGPLERLLNSVLPHEVTHTVFAYHFKQPVPRWADEGGSVLSEDNIERDKHNKIVRQILNSGQQIPMRTLFGLREYPRKVICLYAQGYSISDYLVKRSNKQTFLNFVAHGMSRGWDQAAWTYYKHRSVEEMETAWLKYLQSTRGKPHTQVVSAQPNNNERWQPAGQRPKQSYTATQSTQSGNGTFVRLTVPPAFTESSQQPQPVPVVRAQNPNDNYQRYGQQAKQYTQPQQQYLPRVNTSNQTWQTPQDNPQPSFQPVPVRLGAPVYGNIPPGTTQVPRNVSPVGFPTQ